MTLANVQEATGQTDRDQSTRLMRAFNTPFFPDILVCSEVMGEGVDLHRYCRYVIHCHQTVEHIGVHELPGSVELACLEVRAILEHVANPLVVNHVGPTSFKQIRDC